MITHLFFADDSLIFFKATKDNTDLVKDSLSTYEKASGQLINFDKSAITFSRNTPPAIFSISRITSISRSAKDTTFI